jgi:hypothetical protein
MKVLRLLTLALACTLPAVAMAQWQWIDKDGRKVFSDRPPPSDIPADKVLKRPGGSSAAAAAMAPAEAAAPGSTATAAATAARPAGSAPQLSGKDKGLEDKKKQNEAAEAAKKKAEEEKFAQAKQENCARLRTSRASFDSGVRIARTDSKGETIYLDDNERKAETKRLDSLIARDCKPQ